MNNELPKLLYSAAQSRAIDKAVIEETGVSGSELMARAGQAAFAILHRRWPQASVGIVCGVGNNGGDGYIVARLAQLAGHRVRVFQMGDSRKLSPDAEVARQQYLELGGVIEPTLDTVIASSDVIVDALLGTGLDRDVTGEWQTTIDAINAANKRVIALDIPSGLHADSGRVLGVAVCADVTVSFITLKLGLVTGAAGDYCGELFCDELDVPESAMRRQIPLAERLALQDYQAHLMPRKATGHKGSYGHVLVVGGGPGMPGAPRMAAQAAYRSGAGLVSVATHEANAAAVTSTCPEVMAHAVVNPNALEPLLNKASVVAVGPGLGRSGWSQQLFATAMTFGGPLVVDADALNLLVDNPLYNDDWILTPHPGEAARLLGCHTRDVQNNRYQAAADIQQKYGGVCVLKGFGTVVVDSQGANVCTDGNPGMGSGGMGDVLTGVIAGILAQLNDLSIAAKLGVCLHACAGDIAAQQGQRGMIATDLMHPIRQLVNPLSC